MHEIAADTWDSCRARPVPQPRPPRERSKGSGSRRGRKTGAGAGAVSNADGAASRGAGHAAPAHGTARPRTGPGRFPHIALTAGVVALAVALLAALLVILRLDEDGTPADVAAPPRTTAASPPPSYACHIARVDGRWSAGVNNGRDTEISYGATGADVAEAQCLLRRAGISPGGIDGMFGPLTLRAVKAFQHRAGLVADGMLGPRSWKALRG